MTIFDPARIFYTCDGNFDEDDGLPETVEELMDGVCVSVVMDDGERYVPLHYGRNTSERQGLTYVFDLDKADAFASPEEAVRARIANDRKYAAGLVALADRMEALIDKGANTKPRTAREG